MQQKIDFKLARALLGLSEDVLVRLGDTLSEQGFLIDGARRIRPEFLLMTPVQVITQRVRDMYPAGLPMVSGRIPQTIGELVTAERFDSKLCDFTVASGCNEATTHQRRIDRVNHSDAGELSLERVAC